MRPSRVLSRLVVLHLRNLFQGMSASDAFTDDHLVPLEILLLFLYRNSLARTLPKSTSGDYILEYLCRMDKGQRVRGAAFCIFCGFHSPTRQTNQAAILCTLLERQEHGEDSIEEGNLTIGACADRMTGLVKTCPAGSSDFEEIW
ncbi:hypothetical protein SISSUDRAFT_576770 [Sistotremastrum suecicum HHB10207 ss-3]|uniref:Uncharacterized protein n=1 Tax=Sistotremastrum suecicum HHB10207 ss-3 TaxID=1314776 RepID=A0A165XFB7_9AGAM|nr:hypothetical protein SISSUDRAFT_576770 [Sistotremastrum suecicum HHB10207 ss-3]